ncbi:MAG: cytochrome c3 family protein [Myxococcota bacterium]|jgi:hypothetical protein|nr:cytochrome c3 family protein [Myxococcota bacterium]MBP8971166.1 cytochrome c3 family protein [Myxococcota bacterium]HQL56220.1 cytochrome c3 family protein [Myxococcota bacterium]
MKRMHNSILMVAVAVIGLVALAGCGNLVKRQDKIKFSHKLHVVDNEIGCDDCHQEVIDSDKVTPEMRFTEAKCLDCHEKEEGGCGMCHTNPDKPETWTGRPPSQGVAFSHAKHAEPTDGQCKTCHAGVEQRTAPSQAARPLNHDTCMSCHRAEFRDISCKACHNDIVENPSRPTALFSHDAEFMGRHGSLAKTDEDVCAHCHRQDFCAECHGFQGMAPDIRFSERVDRQLVHRGDYLTRHPIEARTDPASCQKCHSTRQCQACHEQARIAQTAAPIGDRASPHPAGWAMDARSAEFHGDAARRDIVSCASCHDQGANSNCITCHKVGGTAGRSPHPRGWNPTTSKDTKMCKMCHGG